MRRLTMRLRSTEALSFLNPSMADLCIVYHQHPRDSHQYRRQHKPDSLLNNQDLCRSRLRPILMVLPRLKRLFPLDTDLLRPLRRQVSLLRFIRRRRWAFINRLLDRVISLTSNIRLRRLHLHPLYHIHLQVLHNPYPRLPTQHPLISTLPFLPHHIPHSLSHHSNILHIHQPHPHLRSKALYNIILHLPYQALVRCLPQVNKTDQLIQPLLHILYCRPRNLHI